VKKWIITILLTATLLALAVATHFWGARIIKFAIDNDKTVDALKKLLELLLAIAGLVPPIIKVLFGDKDSKAASAITNAHAARDVNTAGRDVQTGGTRAERDLSVGRDLINQQTIINQAVAQTSAPTLSPLHQLPPPPADFTGRTAELRELRAAIENGGIHISGLQGQGGVGKTALALKLAEELSPNYADAQIYLDLKGVSENPLTAAEAMSHVLRTFHPEAKLPEKEEDLRAQYLSVLHNKRALLLMDNAKDAAQVKPLIPPPDCALLVTSRLHFVLPGLQAKNLETLPLPDAKDLLLQIAPRISGEAEAIARLCGYLPQALRLAASAIAVRVNLEPKDYAKQLADEKNRLELLAGDDESVTASITLSYNLLDPETQKRWRTLAVFPDTFNSIAAAAIWEVEDNPAQEALSRLLQFSMLEWNDVTKRYRLHDLMRDFAGKQLTPAERRLAAARHATHFLAVLEAVAERYRAGGRSVMHSLTFFDLERGNIQAGQSWAADQAAKDLQAARLCNSYPRAGGYCLALRLVPRDLVQWLEAALAAARSLEDRAAEGQHLTHLGIVLRDLGETRHAVERLDGALTIFRDIGNRQGEGAALGNLGNAYLQLGEFRRAIEFNRQHLTIAREVADRQGESNALGNLGAAYGALGEVPQAVEYLEQRLTVAREIGDRKGEGSTLGNLGNAHYALNETQRAIECYELSLAIKREIGDRIGESNTLGNLGNVCFDKDELRPAIQYYEEQLAIVRKVGFRSGEASGLWNISLVMDKLGDRKRAIEHAEAALKILEEIDDPRTAEVRKQIDIWRNG
jgi:tetratricopeptide (TPR) repeat protein